MPSRVTRVRPRYAQRPVATTAPTSGNSPALRITQRCSYGGILSPLLANIALSVLDEHLHGGWQPTGDMATSSIRARRRSKGQPNWRVVRYADDFVVLVHGSRADVEALREDVAQVLQPLGLRLSESKTQLVHMSDGFDFLGFHIQWRRKYGTNKWHVYTFIGTRPIRSRRRRSVP
jgi:RNA-directed DNA polymerase